MDVVFTVLVNARTFLILFFWKYVRVYTRQLVYNFWPVSCSGFTSQPQVLAAILAYYCQIENPTPQIDACLLEEYSCQISSRSSLKRRSLGLFLEKSPQQAEGRQQQEQEQDE